MTDARRTINANCIGWTVKKKNDQWVADGAPKPIDFREGQVVTFVSLMLDVEPRTVLISREDGEGGDEGLAEVRESFLSAT
jgi:hypothetical protein